jgi:hypothetical protein
VIVEAYPQPSAAVVGCVAELGTAGDQEDAGDPSRLERPWDLATCAPDLRYTVWSWLEDVASWINRQHVWRPERAIPPCWPQHPHIANELAVLACQRLDAGRATTTGSLATWQDHTLPRFLDRIAAELGTGCLPGRHTEWPAAARYRAFSDPAAIEQRQRYFDADAATLPLEPPSSGGTSTLGGGVV